MSYLILLTLCLAPAYVVRFNLTDFPTNLLMTWVFLVWVIFLFYLIVKNYLLNFVTFVTKFNKAVFLLVGLFFLSGLISLFINGFDRVKLGQFIVLFLQPISIYFISGFIITKLPESKSLILNTCYLLLGFAGAYAIFQYFTLLGLPPAWWGNSVEPKRALSFFVHPNFYALWSAPLLAFLLPDLFLTLKLKILNLKSITWLLGSIGLLLSLSRAGWLGLGAAMLIYLIFVANQKIRKISAVIVIIMVIIVASVPNLRWRFTLPLYGEKSAVSRLSLWHTGVKAIKESPLLGLGLTGFNQNWPRLNSDADLTDTHNFPHNVFLNFWVETGILGLISFIGLAWLFIHRGFKIVSLSRREEGQGEVERLQSDHTIKLGIALFLITLITQGLIDNPYFKNDLAMVFWIILSLI